MKKKLELFVITHPQNFLDEEKYISCFLENEVGGIYLRKEKYSQEYFTRIFKLIDREKQGKMILPFSAMGEKFIQNSCPVFHLKEDERDKVKIDRLYPETSFSTSIHDIAQWEKLSPCFKYVFYSPVFESISKNDHKPKKTLSELAVKITKCRNNGKKLAQLIALGGINEHNVTTLSQAGFDGAALFGSLWNSLDPERAFMKVKEKLDP